MSTLNEVEEKLDRELSGGGVISDEEVTHLINVTEEVCHTTFFQRGDFDMKVLESLLNILVEQLNGSVHEHTKTRMLIVLNNIAMYKECRPLIFSAVKTLDLAMERSMKVEGTMPFDSELGRMSEHMLVLLCRVQGFKIRANQVLEFAEGNVQFAVQLLLAILLKEPPYEFELRVNCMTGLLGFSSPCAFFTPEASDSIQEKALEDFEQKINQICKLAKRLLVMQVVAEAINPHLISEGPVQPVVHVACQSIMKFVTNVFNYATQQATAFRQHIITATTFVDQVVVPYICKLIQQVAKQYEVHDEKMNVTSGFNPLRPPPRQAAVPREVVQGLVTSLRFLALCSFHMGSYGRTLRFFNSFTHDTLRLPLCFLEQVPEMFAALLQFNCNVDSLSGEEKIPQADHLPPECTSKYILGNLSSVLGAMGHDPLTQLRKHFHRTQQTLLARDVGSFNTVDEMITQAIEDRALGKQHVAGGEQQSGQSEFRLLGDLPDPACARSIDKVAGVELEKADAIKTDDRLVKPNAAIETLQAEGTAPANFRCSLNGHLMKDPVRSPHGHVFERETIMKWLESAGSTCPFTGKPMASGDLQDDLDLRAAIASWHIKESMQANDEDEFDVYDF
eukprot:TRINITY_DN796_c0_g2_i1.p1 TRINITY_DN796_c0_g2~~TRINITY_DN796_c0_g2_i1.p1  ORF type:complete len:620 (+),score=198.50 TRINITY_DN796_c0_g2_i1:222-2081(+)